MASGDDLYHHFNNHQDEILCRPLAEFAESIWTDRLDSITTLDMEEYDLHAKVIETLKEEVRSLLKAKGTIMGKLKLIDTMEQLGISYHYEQEIEQLLEEIFNQQSGFVENLQDDLYATALHFRLLRQHGFSISSGIFRQFLNDNGKFKESLSSDIEGLLSLYESAHLRTHEDSILEEALSFTTGHLKRGSPAMSSSLAKQVGHALEQSLQRGVPRVEARHYISVYEEDEARNPLLLKLAKLDYRFLQMLHRKELDEILRWGKDLKIASKVPYSRNRFVECYFWALGVFFEPQYSFNRIIFAKTAILLTVVDDTYDAYGTCDELKSFTDAFERWDVKEINQLPEYMKTTFVDLLSFSGWLEEELTIRGRSYAFSKYKEEWKQYARTNYTQSCWFLTRELPPFSEYFENALITSAYYQLAPTSFLIMESGTKDVFDWLAKNPKIHVACAKICRFINDVASYEDEKRRAATGIECYMKQYQVTEEEAMQKFEEIGENAWKDINEEFLRQRAIPRGILMRLLNLARLIDAVYKHRKDGFTNPHQTMEPLVVAVLLDPIIV